MSEKSVNIKIDYIVVIYLFIHLLEIIPSYLYQYRPHIHCQEEELKRVVNNWYNHGNVKLMTQRITTLPQII